jgi:hypothetical protein
MSGWQRIGVVISVLWLVGLPVYTLMDHNRRAQGRYVDCLINLRGLKASDVIPGVSNEEWCGSWNVSISPLDAFGVFVGRSYAPGIGRIEHTYDMAVAMIVWAPIILLWLVGWIVLNTVRWVRRGFTGPGR